MIRIDRLETLVHLCIPSAPKKSRGFFSYVLYANRVLAGNAPALVAQTCTGAPAPPVHLHAPKTIGVFPYPYPNYFPNVSKLDKNCVYDRLKTRVHRCTGAPPVHLFAPKNPRSKIIVDYHQPMAVLFTELSIIIHVWLTHFIRPLHGRAEFSLFKFKLPCSRLY